jgi:branched-chain amino acid aminotransferase
LLAGVTRKLLLSEVAPRAGVTAREAVVRPEELGAMDECFLLSTTKDVTPVSAVDEQRFAVAAESITHRLKVAFAEFTHDYALRRRAELTV